MSLFPPRRSLVVSGLYVGLALVGLIVASALLSNIGSTGIVFSGGFYIGLLALVVSGIVMSTLLYARKKERGATQRVDELEFELHESEERFRQAQKMEAMGQLAGGIAHDFNNLVTVIRCSVGLLAEYIGPEDPGNEELSQIREAAERAGALTRQLLAFSRRQALEPRSIDLNTVVRDLVGMLDRILGTHIQVHTDLDQSIAPIFADIGQIEQVIVNLAVNARDAIPAAGGAIFLATELETLETPLSRGDREIPSGSYVTLTVRDTGRGIDPENLKRVFEPFFTTKVVGQGTGLGLSIVQGIIHEAGGYITIESLPNEGTTVTLYFPTPIEVQQQIAADRQS